MIRLSVAVLVIACVGHQAIGRDFVVGERNTVGSDLKGSTLGCCSTSDAKSIGDRRNRYLDDLAANACGTGMSFVEKVDKAASTLAALRKIILTSRSQNPYLEEEDMILLGSVEDNIDEAQWLPGGKLSGKVVLRFEIDLAEQFSAHYARYYAICDDGKLGLDDFRHDWARKIYAGLSCLRIPEIYR